MPPELRIHFALRWPGHRHGVEVSRIDPAVFLAAFSAFNTGVPPDQPVLWGSYVFVHRGRVWNHDTNRPPVYDPDQVQALLYDLPRAHFILPDLMTLFEQQGHVSALLEEFFLLRLKRWQGHRLAVMTGLGWNGEYIYPSIQVELAHFWRELLGATEAYLRLCRGLLAARGATATKRAPALARSLDVTAWEREAARLRARTGAVDE